MKVKYKFDHIDSEADSLSLKAYGVEIANFKKADFGENWEDLLGQKFELSPYLVGDLDKLQITGLETNDITCNSNQTKKDLWKEYSRNKIDVSVIKEKANDIDNSKPIEITNLKNENIFSYVNDEFKSFNQIDLSNLICDNERFGSSGYSCGLDNDTFAPKIYKLPKINSKLDTSSLKAIDLSRFTNMVELPDIIYGNYSCFYLKNNNNIEEIPQIDSLRFSGTTKILELIDCKKVNFSQTQHFNNFTRFIISGCDSIKYINFISLYFTNKENYNFNSSDSLTIDNLQILNTTSTKDIADIFKGDTKKYIKYLVIPLSDNNNTFNFKTWNSNLELGVVYAFGSENLYYQLRAYPNQLASGIFIPIKAKAFPAGIFRLSTTNSVSIPEDYNSICWVDDINFYNSTDPFMAYIKKILTVSFPKEIIINTLKKEIKEEADAITINVPFEYIINPEYPYDIKIKNFKVYSNYCQIKSYGDLYYNHPNNNKWNVYPTITESNVNNNYPVLDNNTITFKINKIYNIKDNAKITISFQIWCEYLAVIDGCSFHGIINNKYEDFDIIFNLNEGASMSFDFEDDDGNPLNLPLEPSTENTEPSTEQTEQVPNE